MNMKILVKLYAHNDQSMRINPDNKDNIFNQSCLGQTKVLAHNFPNVSYVASCVNQIWLMWANRTNRKVQKGPQREQ